MLTLSEFFIRVNDINEYSCNKIDFFTIFVYINTKMIRAIVSMPALVIY